MSWAAEPSITGEGCSHGVGVTVAVDYSLNGTNVDIRCAIGAPGTIIDAFKAAGFEVHDSSGWILDIDGLDPTAEYGWEGFWGLYTSTVSGSNVGNPSDVWTFAQVGAGSGPVSTDQAYMFRVFETWDCMLADYDPQWLYEMDDPSICTTTPTLQEVLPWLGNITLPPSPTQVLADPDAQAAAAWLAAQLAAQDDVALTNGATDWGLTIDALLGLISVKVAGDQINATAEKLYASGTAYIGTQAESPMKWPAIAKMTLALQAAGLDPMAFPTSSGTRNLLFDLRSVLNADGSFGDPATSSAFSHALAMIVLARTDGGVPASALAWLTQQQCTTAAAADYGSFGWVGGCGGADTDVTSLAAQALAATGVTGTDSPLAWAQEWLLTQQDDSGGFLSWGTPNANATGLAVLALQDTSPAASTLAAQYIGGLQITCERVKDSTDTLEVVDIGAIAYDQVGFEGAVELGLGSGLGEQFFRATSQAILGFGGANFVYMSSEGATADVPARVCELPEAPMPTPEPTTPEPTTPVQTPAPTVEPTTPAPTPGPVVDTGGTTLSNPAQTPAALICIGFLLLIVVAGLQRKAGKVK
ncbi:MAG: terpene cyclase/mutase family protein [Propionibacteriaceae bacterium]|nr:terpene cyclase/mutase family protein [Propionibacteriaceae bacterium]